MGASSSQHSLGQAMHRASFASGTLDARPVSDVFHFGGKKVTSHMLLMADANFSFDGEMEGILGLSPLQMAHSPISKAGVRRFTLCLGSGGQGALRFDAPRSPSRLHTLGGARWSLPLHGVSLGFEALLCDGEPCTALLDSGSTALLAPRGHLEVVYDSLCRSWPRCRARLAEGRDAGAQFQQLLLGCASWSNSSSLDGELPELHFQVAHKDLRIPPSAYVLNVTATDRLKELENSSWICLPAFDELEYPGKRQTWVLGMPLFRRFAVSFELGTAEERPSVSFAALAGERCELCDSDSSAAVTSLRADGSMAPAPG